MIINELESGILYASVHFDYLTSFSMRCVSLTVYPAVSHHMRIYACVCVCGCAATEFIHTWFTALDFDLCECPSLMRFRCGNERFFLLPSPPPSPSLCLTHCRHKFSVWAWNMWNPCDGAAIILFLIGLAFRFRPSTMDIGRVIYCVDSIYWYLRILNILGVNKYLGK